MSLDQMSLVFKRYGLNDTIQIQQNVRSYLVVLIIYTSTPSDMTILTPKLILAKFLSKKSWSLGTIIILSMLNLSPFLFSDARLIERGQITSALVLSFLKRLPQKICGTVNTMPSKHCRHEKVLYSSPTSRNPVDEYK